MKINSLNTCSNFINKPKSISPKRGDFHAEKTFKLSNYTAENVRANFISFGNNYRKVRDVKIYDKSKREFVSASLEHKRDYFDEYRIMKDGKKLGFMTFDEETNIGLMEDIKGFSDGVMPRIAALRTIEGDRYSGIGTQLVKEAVEKSFQTGYDGLVCLSAQKYFAKQDSSYRSEDSPIPFYYKLGFRSPQAQINNLIEKSIKLDLPQMLPMETFMVLKPSNVYKFDDYYKSKFPNEESSQ